MGSFKPGLQAQANPGELLQLAVEVDGLGGSAPKDDAEVVSPPEALPTQDLPAAHMVQQKQAPAQDGPEGHIQAGEVGRQLEQKAEQK